MVALTQRADDGGRNTHAPAAVCLYDAGEGLATNGHGDDVACRRAARLPGNNLRLSLLAGVEDIVARDGVDGDDRRVGIYREIRGHGRTVARFVADVHRQGVVTLIKGLHLAGRQRDGPGAVAAHRGVIIFAVQRHRHNLPGFRVGFTTQRQRLVVLSGINDVVLRERIDGERWRSGIHANRLASAHGVTRRVFAADADGPGTVAERLRVCRRHVNAPRAVCSHLSGVDFSVQRYGNVGSLRQMLAAAGQRKACGLFAGVNHVVTRRCRQRKRGLGRRNGHGDVAR